METIQETLAELRAKVNTQDVALKNLELNVGSMREEIWQLDQVDDADRVSAMQKLTHLQHKVESALQDRHAAH